MSVTSHDGHFSAKRYLVYLFLSVSYLMHLLYEDSIRIILNRFLQLGAGKGACLGMFWVARYVATFKPFSHFSILGKFDEM